MTKGNQEKAHIALQEVSRRLAQWEQMVPLIRALAELRRPVAEGSRHKFVPDTDRTRELWNQLFQTIEY